MRFLYSAHLMAAGPNFGGMHALIIKFVALALGIIGCGIILSSRKGKVSEAGNTAIIAIIGVIFVVAAAVIMSISSWIAHQAWTG